MKPSIFFGEVLVNSYSEWKSSSCRSTNQMKLSVRMQHFTRTTCNVSWHHIWVCILCVYNLLRHSHDTHTHTHTGCKISDATFKDYVSVEKAYKALQKAAISKARAKRMQRGRSGSIEKFWNPISTCLVCVPGLHHPRSVKIDLEKFDFEKGVVVDDDGEKKKDE